MPDRLESAMAPILLGMFATVNLYNGVEINCMVLIYHKLKMSLKRLQMEV